MALPFVLSLRKGAERVVIVREKIEAVSTAVLNRFAQNAKRRVGLAGEVSILITSSDEVRQLNRKFRKKNKATDVLSFPSHDFENSGDIAISWEIARENGDALGHGTPTELKVLILHGMLHLAGYDHESDSGEMATLEMELRKKLRLPQGLIERVIGKGGAARNKRSVKR